jgi:hypothetical protein
VLLDNVIYFGSWDCHLYALNADAGGEVWRFTTNTSRQSYDPPPHPNFRIEIKKETHIEDAINEDKYKSKRKGETVSLSDYRVESEYSSDVDYKQKSEYETNFVILEIVAEDIIWSSSGTLNPDLRISKQS